MRRLMAPICVAAVLGGLAAWFFHSPLYRSLDPLQVPRVLLLYVLPERYFTPMDVVLWGTTQSIRGDSRLIDKIEANPQPNVPGNSLPIHVLRPGHWAVLFHKHGVSLTAQVTADKVIADYKGRELVINEVVQLVLVHSQAGWKLNRATVVSSKTAPFLDNRS